MQSLLLELNRCSEAIEASAVISKDGLVMAAAIPEGFNEDALGEISATIIHMADYTSREFDCGSFEYVVIKSTQNNVLIAYVSRDVLLAVVLKADAQLEEIAAHVKHSSEKIAVQLARI